jgi:phage gpG-like protein
MPDKPIKVKGLTELGQKVKKRISAYNNMAPAFKKAVTLYHGWVLRNFRAGGRLHENKIYVWPALEDSTIVSRRKGGGGAKILQDTGALHRDWELMSNKSRGIIQSAHKYSGVHEYGTKKAGRNRNVTIPQRKIFPTVKQARKIIHTAFVEHLKW